ncbi:MAG TPA: type II secretion system protein GspM [Bryobacteraceae bacterium]|nr:type II secretion system protein GspM [Bryobacteraceae bacterium]
MTISSRDRRALIVLAFSLMLGGFIYWFSNSTPSAPAGSAAVAPPVDSIDHAQKRLAILRKQAATLPGHEAVLKQASAELSQREKGLIPGETADEAQAQLLQVVKRVARQQTPPLEMSQIELGRPRTYGSAYGQVSVSITLTCRIEDLVNFLAGLGAQPELVATEEIRFGAARNKQKTIPIRLTVTGLVARRLIPKEKGIPQL